jgi:hypothetical protein
MKQLNIIILFLTGIFTITDAAGQANATINILTGNTGIVALGGTVDVDVQINNTGPVSNIGAYKIKCQLTVPTSIASIAATQTKLPPGWTILSQNTGVINLSNGTDVIAPGTARSFTITVRGDALGGPLTCGSQLNFSNGNPPGSAPGTLAGNNTADDASQSTVLVTNTTPVTISDFNAAITKQQPFRN